MSHILNCLIEEIINFLSHDHWPLVCVYSCSGQSDGQGDEASAPPKKQFSPDMGVEKIRDMIAHCYLNKRNEGWFDL